ncbi:hypothetical protein HPB50_015684 [Hyalomma asiaticum]|uniref:Uncharacterized protein n=1 Tax=Hyalomma asiaticum TaxID=266040 RepID=A0ACB7SYB4_HYAAI|nr:hypothetical protein HPB50_015684 [Hyalomma asiaticum]
MTVHSGKSVGDRVQQRQQMTTAGDSRVTTRSNKTARPSALSARDPRRSVIRHKRSRRRGCSRGRAVDEQNIATKEDDDGDDASSTHKTAAKLTAAYCGGVWPRFLEAAKASRRTLVRRPKTRAFSESRGAKQPPAGEGERNETEEAWLDGWGRDVAEEEQYRYVLCSFEPRALLSCSSVVVRLRRLGTTGASRGYL